MYPKNQYLDLIFPFNKLKSSENSIEKDRNYLGRSHNLLITLLDNYGILFLLALLYSLFYALFFAISSNFLS